ncbi:hypothetical protein COP1_034873 [Malus domestica]
MRLVHHEELSTEPPKGHVMFYTQILLTLGVNLPLHPWLQQMLSFIGYASGQLYPGFWNTLIGFYIIWMECGLGEPSFHQWRYCDKMRPVKRIVFGKKKAYCTWKNHWCFLYNDWEYAKGVTHERLTRGTIKLSGRKLADIKKVLRVITEYDDRLREVEWYKAKFKENKQFVNDARKTSKALVDAIFLKDENFESLKRQNGENVRLKKQLEATKEQLETTILEVSKVKRELDSALVEVSGLKRNIPTERDAVVQEFLGSQAFHDAFRPHCIRAANFEKRKWMVVLERYNNGSIIRKYRDEMDEYRQKGETFILAVDPSSDDNSDNEASISEQSQESEDGPGDAEEGGDSDGVET